MLDMVTNSGGKKGYSLVFMYNTHSLNFRHIKEMLFSLYVTFDLRHNLHSVIASWIW